MKIERFEHRFVENFPESLESGVLYVSMTFASVAHNCACGCGKEVVTPLSPVRWNLTFDGEAISLSPSIGNWGFPCRSHYWIELSEVVWSYDMSEGEIAKGRVRAQRARAAYYSAPPAPLRGPSPSLIVRSEPKPRSAWSRLLERIVGKE